MAGTLKAVLFDLDGTLLDTAPDFETVLNDMLRERGREPIPYLRIRQTVSEGARALITLGFRLAPTAPEFDSLHQDLLTRYESGLSQKTTLFDGMDEVLAFLEGAQLSWGIVTNKPQRYTDAILADLELAGRCATAVCPDHVAHRKPHPEPMLLACSQLRCNPAETIYIGDHRRDIEAGLNAGMQTIAAAWGYAHPEDPPHSWGADRIAEQSRDILPIIHSRINRES